MEIAEAELGRQLGRTTVDVPVDNPLRRIRRIGVASGRMTPPNKLEYFRVAEPIPDLATKLTYDVTSLHVPLSFRDFIVWLR